MNTPYVIYYSMTCKGSKLLIDSLKARGVANQFRYVDISKNKGRLPAFVKGTPTLVYGNKVLTGRQVLQWAKVPIPNRQGPMNPTERFLQQNMTMATRPGNGQFDKSSASGMFQQSKSGPKEMFAGGSMSSGSGYASIHATGTMLKDEAFSGSFSSTHDGGMFSGMAPISAIENFRIPAPEDTNQNITDRSKMDLMIENQERLRGAVGRH